MQAISLIFPIVVFASVCMGTWGIGMVHFHRKDKAAGRPSNGPSGVHLLWACLFPLPLLAYLIAYGFPTGAPTSGGIFVEATIAEFLAAGIIFCVHEAWYGRIGNKGERVLMAFCAIALFVGAAAFTLFT